MARVAPEEEAEKYRGLLDLLTPVAKSYPSEMGILATSAGIQCLGGYGYCEDFPLQQYFRDIRIHPIHEGTTGIQAMDLLGRKVLMHEGKWFRLFMENIEKSVTEAPAQPALADHGKRLSAAAKRLETVTMHLVEIAMTQSPEVFLADAVLYLELFGLVAIGWQWLLQGIAAQQCLADGAGESARRFYTGKILTCDYFFAYELPKTQGLAERLMDGNPLTVEMSSDLFQD
jgi:butyryl-CoA dehydrogenase